MTFAQVLEAAGFAFEDIWIGPGNWGLGARPAGLVIPSRGFFYRLVDDDARASIGWYDSGLCTLVVSLQLGPAEFAIVGGWDNPEAAGRELAGALAAARKRVESLHDGDRTNSASGGRNS